MSQVSQKTPASCVKQTFASRVGELKMVSSLWVNDRRSSVLVWIRSMKFTSAKSKGIGSFVENSPLASWAAQMLGIQDPSNLLGCIEILKTVLMELRNWIPTVSAIGGRLTAQTLTIVLMFLAAAPGAWVNAPGELPFLAVPVQLALKEIVLPAASLWSLGEAVLKQRLANDL